jgi:hypothetical protein
MAMRPATASRMPPQRSATAAKGAGEEGGVASVFFIVW